MGFKGRVKEPLRFGEDVTELMIRYPNGKLLVYHNRDQVLLSDDVQVYDNWFLIRVVYEAHSGVWTVWFV